MAQNQLWKKFLLVKLGIQSEVSCQEVFNLQQGFLALGSHQLGIGRNL